MISEQVLSRRAAVLKAVGMMALLTVGCGRRKPKVPFGTVTGTVTLDGSPLAGAAVMFEPPDGRPSYGTTDENGVYRLLYRGQPWGAIAGQHVVRITTEALIVDSPDSPEAAPQVIKERLPKRYHSESTLTADVVEGANVLDFSLTSQ